jgi:hypothetical protein
MAMDLSADFLQRRPANFRPMIQASRSRAKRMNAIDEKPEVQHERS